ncbi:low molecular weight phosphatase family protein [Robertkochia flava]|uniref:protein-tyrosine-phosphatase n=1 Tax=Robertkochia flava TaxID=3447986 RepID=UPI001CCA9979|nr:protein-tyrosine-phosphatase [Robertkochia marina]
MLFEPLQHFIENIDTGKVSEDRKEALLTLRDYVLAMLRKEGEVNLNFICTHNSRRSHLAQVWAQCAAYYYGFGRNIRCYSGGTEATAMYLSVAGVLSESGFHIDRLSEGENPIYSIKYGFNQPAVIGFSKEYHHTFNPAEGFIAIMTCDQASEACPVVTGAAARVSVTYEDPKKFDDTPEKLSKYQERSEQIATEMFWVFNQLKSDFTYGQ